MSISTNASVLDSFCIRQWVIFDVNLEVLKRHGNMLIVTFGGRYRTPIARHTALREERQWIETNLLNDGRNPQPR